MTVLIELSVLNLLVWRKLPVLLVRHSYILYNAQFCGVTPELAELLKLVAAFLAGGVYVDKRARNFMIGMNTTKYILT